MIQSISIGVETRYTMNLKAPHAFVQDQPFTWGRHIEVSIILIEIKGNLLN